MPVSIRYIVNDVGAAVEFYTEALGFKLDIFPALGFAGLSRGDLHLLLNRPGAGGWTGHARRPTAGFRWLERFQIEFDDLAGTVEKLK